MNKIAKEANSKQKGVEENMKEFHRLTCNKPFLM